MSISEHLGINTLLMIEAVVLLIISYRIDWATDPCSDTVLVTGQRIRRQTLVSYYCALISAFAALTAVIARIFIDSILKMPESFAYSFVIIGIVLAFEAIFVAFRYGRFFVSDPAEGVVSVYTMDDKTPVKVEEIETTTYDPETLELRNLVCQFESMGHDCELGLIQRHFGAEPLGMFRWGGTHLVYMVEMLEANFSGIDELCNNELKVINGEYYVANSKYKVGRHANAFVRDNPDPEKLLRKQVNVTTFFVRHFREQMESGERIFVFKDYDNAGPRAIQQLSKALRRHGPVELLVVQAHGREGEPAELEPVGDHAWLGRIDRFGRPGGSYPSGWDISMESWLTLLNWACSEISKSRTQKVLAGNSVCVGHDGWK